MRSRVVVISSSLLAAACSQLLGIDGRYERDEAPPSSGGARSLPDAGMGGRAEQPPIQVGSAGGATSMDMQDPTLTPPPEMGGVPVRPPYERDAGHSSCAPGYKVCGEVCTEMTPAFGCAGLTCQACNTPMNARTRCGADGACESICNAGFVPAGSDCVPAPKGTGGTAGRTGAGGSPPDAGSSGGAQGEQPCDPLKCPTCNRGFEGCCIPSLPDGTPSRCGCFYFPPLCTARVG